MNQSAPRGYTREELEERGFEHKKVGTVEYMVGEENNDTAVYRKAIGQDTVPRRVRVYIFNGTSFG